MVKRPKQEYYYNKFIKDFKNGSHKKKKKALKKKDLQMVKPLKSGAAVINSALAIFSSVQFNCSVVFYSVTLWTAARQASLSITNSQSLLKLTSMN